MVLLSQAHRNFSKYSFPVHFMLSDQGKYLLQTAESIRSRVSGKKNPAFLGRKGWGRSWTNLPAKIYRCWLCRVEGRGGEEKYFSFSVLAFMWTYPLAKL